MIDSKQIKDGKTLSGGNIITAENEQCESYVILGKNVRNANNSLELIELLKSVFGIGDIASEAKRYKMYWIVWSVLWKELGKEELHLTRTRSLKRLVVLF